MKVGWEIVTQVSHSSTVYENKSPLMNRRLISPLLVGFPKEGEQLLGLQVGRGEKGNDEEVCNQLE